MRHRNLLAQLVSLESGVDALQGIVTQSQTAEAVGMRAIALANRAEGIMRAYPDDVEMFTEWMLGVGDE